MKTTYLVVVLAMLMCVFLASSTCENDDGDEANDDVDLDDDDNNDTVDDDLADDDLTDDDDTTDDDSNVDDDADDDDVGPIISNPYYDPLPLELRENPGYGQMWYTEIHFDVCDPDNDLLPDGRIVIIDTETSIDPYTGPWTDAANVSNGELNAVGDCNQPVNVGFGLFWSPDFLPLPPGEYCLHAIYGLDNFNHNSNTIFNACFTIQ